MTKNISLVASNRGGGYVTITQSAGEKQLSAEKIEAAAAKIMKAACTLLTVNNGTDSRKINPRMREHQPDNRVYTLVLTSKLRKK